MVGDRDINLGIEAGEEVLSLFQVHGVKIKRKRKKNEALWGVQRNEQVKEGAKEDI